MSTEKSVLDRYLIVTMPNGERWAVPVRVIAENRAKEYAHEFIGDEARSLKEDTLPLFDEDEYEIKDWAANNMNWRDVKPYAKKLPVAAQVVDYEDGWVNGEKEIGDLP